MENVGIFYGHLEQLTAIWYTLRSFGNVVIIWFILPCWYIVFRIIWQPCSKVTLNTRLQGPLSSGVVTQLGRLHGLQNGVIKEAKFSINFMPLHQLFLPTKL
jgi:hypothetical protein